MKFTAKREDILDALMLRAGELRRKRAA